MSYTPLPERSPVPPAPIGEQTWQELQGLYDDQYYRASCGPLPYERTPHWINFFSIIADESIRALHPKTMLDAGCAMGMLVEAFWDRGVEAYGIDFSPYAISKVRRDIAPYCRVASITEPLTGRYDFVTCIEVLEHIPPAQAELAAQNLCQVTDTILFSSDPEDTLEPTHINVRPTISWLRIFAGLGFWPDVHFDASFVTPHAFLLRRASGVPSDESLALLANLIRHKRALINKQDEAARLARHSEKLELRLQASDALKGDSDQLNRNLQAARDELTTEVDHLRSLNQQLQQDSQIQKTQVNALNSDNSRLRQDYEAILREFGALQIQLTFTSENYDRSLTDLNGQLQQERESLRQFSTQLDAERSERALLNQSLIDLQSESQLLVQHLETARQELAAANNLTAQLQGQLAQARDEQLLDAERQKSALLEQGAIDLQSHHRRLTQELQTAQQDAAATKERNAELREQLAEALNQQLPLIRRATVAESELTAVIHSPAWKAVQKYRAWLRIQRDNRPAFFDLYEKTLGRLLTHKPSPSVPPERPPEPVTVPERFPNPVQAPTIAAEDPDYQQWIAENEPGTAALDAQRLDSAKLSYRPLISIVVPVYRVDPTFLRACIDSVMSQTYPFWELCVVHAAPDEQHNLHYLRDVASSDSRIKFQELTSNAGIAGNTNASLALATGEFIAFLDHDDELAPFALFSIVQRLNLNRDLDLLYSDHDYLAASTSCRCNPLFKPDWAPETMLSACYITHSTVVRRSMVEAAGGCDPRTDGAQDWDLFLKVTDSTARVEHIPEILYHWRIHAGSTALTSGAEDKPYAQRAQLAALKAHMDRIGMNAEPVVRTDGLLYVKWLQPATAKVSIIIPTRDKLALLTRCIETLLEKTSYPNYEIVIVDTGSTDPATFDYYKTLSGNSKIRVLEYKEPFNYSAVNNFGAAHSSGELLLFLNNDVELLTNTWLEELVHWSMFKPAGVVGAKLLRPDGKIQHAGVVVGLGGFADHPFAGQESLFFGLAGSTGWYRNWLAVTGACMMMRREVFDQIGRFDEAFILCGSDVEICLRARQHGYRIILNPFVELIHHERQTRGDQIPAGDFVVSENRYGRYLDEGDGYWNCNLSLWNPRGAFRKRGERTSRDFVAEFVKSLHPDSGTDKPRPAVMDRAPSEEENIVAWFDYTEDDLTALRSLWASTVGRREIKHLIWFIPAFDIAYYGGIFTILSFAEYWRRTKGVKSSFAVCGAATAAVMAERIRAVYQDCSKDDVFILASPRDVVDLPQSDACVATLWTTVFYAMKYLKTRRHFYFVQDHEPAFYRAGSASALVSSTYRAGFYGIANTITLRNIYEEHYGGIATHFTPCVNPEIFHSSGRETKTAGPWKVFVYARPQHPRNSFELIAAALRLLKDRLKDRVSIITAGAPWNPADYNLSGVVEHLGLLPYRDTATLYRTCDVGVALMFTRHPSYLPFEFMATGCLVVSNSNHWNKWFLKDGINCLLARPTPSCLAAAIERGLTDGELRSKITAYAADDIRLHYSNWNKEMEDVYEFVCDPEGRNG